MTRQVVLDTETTGLEPAAGHRIIEIGCVELIDRRPTRKTFHRYINPDRAVEVGALEVHGIDDDFLAEQPRFADVVEEFLNFVSGAELVIHNADFDVEFINHELKLLGRELKLLDRGLVRDIRGCCGVLDTLALARRMHPGQRNSLDALAKRYEVDNSKRELHGALLDAQILADIYLAMTGGQVSLLLDGDAEHEAAEVVLAARIERQGLALPVLAASATEEAAHLAFLDKIRAKCGASTIWERVIGMADSAAAAVIEVAGEGAPPEVLTTALALADPPAASSAAGRAPSEGLAAGHKAPAARKAASAGRPSLDGPGEPALVPA